jgi:hypothetical protein
LAICRSFPRKSGRISPNLKGDVKMAPPVFVVDRPAKRN